MRNRRRPIGPSALVQAATAAAALAEPSPDFVLVAGDSVRHAAHKMPGAWADIHAALVNATAEVILSLQTGSHKRCEN